MSNSALGAALSLFTALLWAISPLCFASAGKRIGSMPVAQLRILLAALAFVFVITPLYAAARGNLPAIPTLGQFGWLFLSALTGMIVGDVLTYQALIMIGPRRTTQLYTLGPIAAILLGWLLIGETISGWHMMGIAIVLGATSYAVLSNPARNATAATPADKSPLGLIYGSIGAVLAGVGAVAARQAFRTGPPLDPVLATTFRLSASTVVLWIVPMAHGRVLHTLSHLRHPHTRSRIAWGTLVGPIIGVFCYVAALKFSPAGLVATLSSTSPLFILPMVVIRYSERIGWRIPLATATAIVGVAMICWR